MQSASIAAWDDEAHVIANRRLYHEKFRSTITPKLSGLLGTAMPDASFYLWARVNQLGLSDAEFARALVADYNVVVLPGSTLAREARA